ALGIHFRSVFRNQFMNPYVGCGVVGVSAIFTHVSLRMRLSPHIPRRSVSRPNRAISHALIYIPPPQWPPPLTTCTGRPSSVIHALSYPNQRHVCDAPIGSIT